jgi:uncharacterized membrane protein YgcG
VLGYLLYKLERFDRLIVLLQDGLSRTEVGTKLSMLSADGIGMLRDQSPCFNKGGIKMNAERIGKSALNWLLILLLATPIGIFAQSSGSSARLSQQELDQMLAPIALYPDSLLAQILMAATYPVEVIQADRWVRSNKNLKGDQLNAALDKMNWDLSVKALVPFPQVLAMMSEKLDWTQKVGDAFLAQQGDVMDTIQQLRSKAYAQGSLKNTNQQKVIVEQQVIRVEPANPQVVYMPTYNPTVVYGSWWYPSYPPYPLYPSGAVVATGLISFAAGVAVGSAWNSGWGSWNWGGHQVNANINRNININNNNININNLQTNKWDHDADHRRSNPYRNQDLSERYGQTGKGDQTARRDYRGFDQAGKDRLGQGTAGQGLDQRRGNGNLDRQGTAQTRDLSPQSRQTPAQPNTLNRSDRQGLQDRKAPNAFQGMGRADDTQRFSDRGRTSRQSAGNFGTGGGGRSGGGFSGGGGARGGGGGGRGRR